MYNRLTTSITRFLLLPLLLLVHLNGCKKDNTTPVSEIDAKLAKYTTASGARLGIASLAPEQAEAPGALEERNNDWNNQRVPVYTHYDGTCRLIFRLYGYNPNVVHGGFEAPCSNSSITLKGYSAPNGQGTLLFTQTFPVTGGWQIMTVPQSAYIMFQITRTYRDAPPCRFKFITGDYGFNRGIFEWYNVSYDEVLPVTMGRFAPRDPSSNGGFNEYEEYLCAPWCTWSASVSYLPSEDPWDNPWTTTRLGFFQGEAPEFFIPNDPRVLKDHFVYEKIDHTLYLYPVETSTFDIYSTKAVNVANDENDIISYSVLGANGQGLGPFGWGAAGPFQARLGCNLQYYHEH